MEYDGQVVASNDPLLVAIVEGAMAEFDEVMTTCVKHDARIGDYFVANGMPF